MKHARLVKELEKIGREVTQSSWNDTHFKCIGPIWKVDWFVNKDEATCVNIMSKKDNNDAMIDYFPGWFANTYKEVKKYLSQET